MYKLFTSLVFLFFNVALCFGQEEVRWFYQHGGDSTAFCKQIIVDDCGNVFSIGHFYGTTDFAPTIGGKSISSKGGDDVYVMKLDYNGNFLWVKTFGSGTDETAGSIAIDESGNVLYTGTFTGVVDFDPSAKEFNLTPSDSMGMFVVKLSNDGDFIWSKKIDGSGVIIPNLIKSDFQSDMVITGTFTDEIDFDPSTKVVKLDTNLNQEQFILKLKSNGEYFFASQIITTSFSPVNIDFYFDKNDNIYLSFRSFGFYTTYQDNFNNYIEFEKTTSESVHIFKLTPLGGFSWSNAFMQNSMDEGLNSYTDIDGNSYYSSGMINIGTTDVWIGPGVANVTAQGTGWGVFILKLNSNGNKVVTTVLANSENVPMTNRQKVMQFYPDNLGNAFLYVWSMVGGSLFYGGATYFKFDKTFKNVSKLTNWWFQNEFDKGRSLYFNRSQGSQINMGGTTVLPIGKRNILIYKMNDCESGHTKDSLMATHCEGAHHCGKYFDKTGIYKVLELNPQGCDKEWTLNLAFDKPNPVITKIDQKLQTDPNLESYQWISCNPLSVIPGATSESFTPKSNGDYAVIASKNGCKDTSQCYQLKDFRYETPFLVYPNPALDVLNIQATDYFDSLKDKEIIIMNMLGQKVISSELTNQTTTLNVSGLSKGIYTL